MAGSGNGPFSFLFVQLAAWDALQTGRLPGNVTSIRLGQADAQTRARQNPLAPASSSDPAVDTGMVVAIDLGSRGIKTEVHPRNKSEVARRMGILLRRITYATYDNRTVDSPAFGAVRADDSSGLTVVHITMAHVGRSGLHLHPTHNCTECCALELAGKPSGMIQLGTSDVTVPGNGWRNTSVHLSGDLITATAAAELTDDWRPSYVRYLAVDFPECVVMDVSPGSHLPAGPFLEPVPETQPNNVNTIPVVAHDTAEHTVKKVSKAPLILPAMGFNTWNRFHCDIDEKVIRATADALVATGLAAVGFRYVNLDDCWQVERLPNGTIVADPARFPSGIRALADYVHSRNLKFGIYTARNSQTCQSRPASYQHELLDIAQFCAWGVDYVKIDQCRGPGYKSSQNSWTLFRQGIDACQAKRAAPMYMSVESCSTLGGCGKWVGMLANSWRTANDVMPVWDSIIQNLYANEKLWPIAGLDGPVGGHCE